MLEHHRRLLGVPQHVLETRQARAARHLRRCGIFVHVVENQLQWVDAHPGRRCSVLQVHVVGAEVLGLAATHAVRHLAAVAAAVRPAEHASALCALGAPDVVATTAATVSAAQASTDRDVAASQHFAVLCVSCAASAAPVTTRVDCRLLSGVRELLLCDAVDLHSGVSGRTCVGRRREQRAEERGDRRIWCHLVA
jgi:hypothetical protein